MWLASGQLVVIAIVDFGGVFRPCGVHVCVRIGHDAHGSRLEPSDDLLLPVLTDFECSGMSSQLWGTTTGWPHCWRKACPNAQYYRPRAQCSRTIHMYMHFHTQVLLVELDCYLRFA